MTQDSWIDGIHMETYTPPEDDPPTTELSAAQLHPSLQVPAGLVWKDTDKEESSLNLVTCLDTNNSNNDTAETVLQWRALQRSEFLMQQLVKDPQNPKRGSLPVGTCQVHLGGTAIRLDLVAPIQVVDEDSESHCELMLGSDFVKHHNIEMDLPNHQLVVPDGDNSCVTIPFIQPRGEMETGEE